MKIGEKRGAVEKIHGMSNTRFYNIWYQMKRRCYDKSIPKYRIYGARGIKVSEEWLDFMNFKEDMWELYLAHLAEFGEKNTSIERIDNNGNYCKENCKWATWSEQILNRKLRVAGKFVEIIKEIREGKTQWKIAEELGISQSGISKMLKRKII